MSLAPLLVAADPDPFNLQLLEEACSAVGLDVVTAIDGVQALEMIARQPPTVVLVAADLARQDGFAVQKILREDPELKTLPVLVAVFDEQSELRAELFKVPHVRKPYQVVEVQRAVRAALRRARDRRRKLRENRPPTADLDAITGTAARAQLLLTLDFEKTRAERFRWPLTVGVARVRPAQVATIAACAAGLRNTLRSVDMLFRAGPAEIAIVLPETDLAGADVAFARVRERLADGSFWSDPALPAAGAQVDLAAATLSPGASGGDQLLETALARLP